MILQCQPPYAHTRASPALNKTLSLSLSLSQSRLTTEERHMAYVESCVEGEAYTHLVARLCEDITNPFTNAEQMLKVLHCVYGDSNRTHCDAFVISGSLAPLPSYFGCLSPLCGQSSPQILGIASTTVNSHGQIHYFNTTTMYYIGLFELNFRLRRRIFDTCCQRSVTSQSTSTR